MASFQLSSTLLDAIVLSIVSKSADGTYGYKITQDVRSVMEVSESTLYPVLRRLLKDQMLDTHDQAIAGRNRRYYTITPAGQIQLSQYLKEWKTYRDNIDSIFFGGETR